MNSLAEITKQILRLICRIYFELFPTKPYSILRCFHPMQRNNITLINIIYLTFDYNKTISCITLVGNIILGGQGQLSFYRLSLISLFCSFQLYSATSCRIIIITMNTKVSMEPKKKPSKLINIILY